MKFGAWGQLGILVLSLAVVGLPACGSNADAVELFENGQYERAFDAFQILAEQGDATAVNFIGIHYYIGAGVERDLQRAAAWFERASLLGLPAAQKNLGVMYFRGLGVKQDYHRAYGWMHHARAGGNTEAQKYIDLMQYNVTPNATVIAVETINTQLQTQQRILSERTRG